MTKSERHFYELCADFWRVWRYNKNRKNPPIHYIVFATPKENTVLRKKTTSRLSFFLRFSPDVQVKKITEYDMINKKNSSCSENHEFFYVCIYESNEQIRRKQSARQTMGGRNGGIYDYSGKRKTQLYE